MKNTELISVVNQQWCLVTIRQRKRESFLKYLKNDIERKRLEELILEIVELQESVYEDMILLRISNYPEARKELQTIDHFSNIQRLKPNEAKRMLNR